LGQYLVFLSRVSSVGYPANNLAQEHGFSCGHYQFLSKTSCKI
jgi:hypothetical protein